MRGDTLAVVRPWTAIALLVLGQQVVLLLDTLAKVLTQDLSVWQVAWARFVFHLLPLLPVIYWRYGWGALFKVRQGGLQVLRSVFMVAATCLYFGALSRIPLADAVALVAISPLVITALAPFFLGERVDPRRWLAVGCGFLGVLILVRPGFQTVELGSLLAVACGCVYAGYAIATRHLSLSAPPLVTLAMSAVAGSLVLSGLLLVEPGLWRTPTPLQLGLMVLLGLVAALAHMLLILAYERAPASLLAPFTFTEIAGASIVGLLLFGHFPDFFSWIGIAVIISAGVYNAWLGQRS